MLSKNHHLSRPDFLLARRLGLPLSTKHVSAIAYQPTTDDQRLTTKFSIVLSSKFSKSAVVRNHFRRKIYDFLSQISISNLYLIVYPHPSVLNLNHDQLVVEINQLISKIHP